jgi:hypothetical protein
MPPLLDAAIAAPCCTVRSDVVLDASPKVTVAATFTHVG